MNTTIKALRVTAQVIVGVVSAIAILTIYPERERQRQIQQAKRNIAERKAQIESRVSAIETELSTLKAELKVKDAQTEEAIAMPSAGVAVAHLEIAPIAATAPQSRGSELPKPCDLDESPTITTITTAQPLQFQLCLAAAQEESATAVKQPSSPKSTPTSTALSIRQLKAMASKAKIKNYSNMTKIQLMEALAI